MEEIDSLGVFWLPEHSDDQVSGRLTFTPTGGIDLVLIGEFENRQEDKESQYRITGVIDSRPVTLLDCFSKGVRRRYPGVAESRFRANKLLLGHVLERDNLEFRTVDMELGHLDEWVEQSGIRSERADNDAALLKISCTTPPEQVAIFSRGTLSLGFLCSQKKDLKRAEITQRPYMRIDYVDLTPMKTMLADIGRIQDLISLCIDSSVDVDRIIFRRPDLQARTLSGEEMGAAQRIEFRAPRLQYEHVKDRKVLHAHNMLLTFNELGGLEAVAKWIDAVEIFQRPLHSLMSTRNTDKIYAENRFLNIAFAAEAFHRNTQGGVYMPQQQHDALLAEYLEITPEEHRGWLESRLKYANDAPLPKRLRQLAQQARPATREIVGREGRWANTISQVRNQLTHLGVGPSPIGGSDLYFLSESIYSVVRVCMLSICGVPQNMWQEKSTSQAMTWHKDRIHRAIDSTRAQLGLTHARTQDC